MIASSRQPTVGGAKETSRPSLRVRLSLEAYLFKANLRQANLRQANLTEAFLRPADLVGANLSGAKAKEQTGR
jgi:uncharacterized protein YjbI with pentapeptide repeats